MKILGLCYVMLCIYSYVMLCYVMYSLAYVLLVADVINIVTWLDVAQNWLSLCFKKCNDNSNNNNNNNDNKERKFRQIMMSGSRIKFDEGYVTINKFSNASSPNHSLSRICLLWEESLSWYCIIPVLAVGLFIRY